MPDSEPSVRRIQALPLADNRGHLITYEKGSSRRVHHLPAVARDSEPTPHGAGSFHDPEHHHLLMDRVEAMLNRTGRP